MNWIIYSFLAAIVFTLWNIITKISVKSINIYNFILQYLLIAIIINLCVAYVLNINLFFEINSFISGIFGAIAIIFISNSIYFSKNSGLPLALLRTQIIYTTIANVFIFNTTFDIYKIINIVLIILGSFIISFNEISSKVIYNNWIILAICSGIFSTIFDLFAKKASNIKNNNIYNIIVNNLVSECLTIFLLNIIFNKKAIFAIANNKFKLFTLLNGGLYFLYSFLLMISFNYATNVGYVKAIITSSIILTIILNYVLFHKTISKYSWVGVMLILINIYFLIL